MPQRIAPVSLARSPHQPPTARRPLAAAFGEKVWLALALVLVALSMPAELPAANEPIASDPDGLSFSHPALFIPNVYRSVAELDPSLAAALAGDLQALGAHPEGAHFDLRGGRWGTLLVSHPLIPGTGKGNDLGWGDLGMRPPGGEAELGQAAGAAFLGYLEAHRTALGIDPDQVALRVTVHEGGRLVQIHGAREVEGVPVRRSYVNAVLNGGNLVLLGVRNWGDLEAALDPVVPAARAAEILAGFIRPAAVSGFRAPARTVLVPMAAGADESLIAPGEGYSYRLAWELKPQLGSDRRAWEALVDARTGELLLFADATRYFDRTATGGVFPVANDGLSPGGIPNGVEQPDWPMPFADAVQPFGTSTSANGSGIAEDIGSVFRSRLSGPFVRMNDACGPIEEVAVCGDLDLGAGPGSDCDVPPGRSAGDTHASRTGFFEVNRIKEMARGWLPGNAWLEQQITSNMNIDESCNAFWDGSTINFYTSGEVVSGSSTFICGNTGENAAVFDHEWGHGMDDNDALPDVSEPGEAPADMYAFLRLNDSCIGRGFWIQNARRDDLAGLCDGNGDLCTECSGVRDVDWAKRESGLPHDIDWILKPADSPGVPGVVAPGGCVGAVIGPPPPIPTISAGPCGQSTHCEGNVVSEAVWDLVHRDLAGYDGSAFDFDVNTALNLVTRLHYLGGGNVGFWFQCTSSGAGGCNADGGYLNYLAVDDDNGDLLDGTPHMTAIHAAFDRHQMACPAPLPADSGCAAGPAMPPVAAAAPTAGGAELTWSAVPGASEYWVYKTDGLHGCDFGKERIAITGDTTLSDQGLLPGRTYYYTVEAVGASGSCRSPASDCVAVVPEAREPDLAPHLAFQEVASPLAVLTGDGDDFIDNCETARFSFAVENAGAVDLHDVRVTSITSPSHPGTVILTPLPLPVADLLAAGCGAAGSSAVTGFDFMPEGVGTAEELVFEFTVVSDETLGTPLVGTVRFSATESDFKFFAEHTFGFETDFEGWSIAQGTYTRESPGGGLPPTLVHLASSAFTAGQCDEILSPDLRLTASSTLSLFNQFDIEPSLDAEVFYDRANIGILDTATGVRTTVAPDSGRTYNAGGANGVCVTADQPGWAGPGPGFLESGWSAGALGSASLAGRRVRLSAAYGTDPLLEGRGFQFDEVTLTEFELQVPDESDDVCPVGPNNPPVAADDFDSTERDTAAAIDVLANDFDPDGDPIRIVAVQSPTDAGGAAAIDDGGTPSDPADDRIVYTPPAGFTGMDAFVYAIQDPAGASDSATVTMTVNEDTDPEVCGEIDDADPAIEYRGGWHRRKQGGSNGGHHRRMGSHNTGNGNGSTPIARLVFEGDEVTYFYVMSDRGGAADVFIDGERVETLTYGANQPGKENPTFGHRRTYSGLGAGSHELVIEHLYGATYVDGFGFACDEPEAGADAEEAEFTAITTISSAAASEGPLVEHTVEVGESVRELSVVVEGSLAPITVRLLGPSGGLVATGGSLLGGATSGLDAPVFTAGSYTVQLLQPGADVEISVARTVER